MNSQNGKVYTELPGFLPVIGSVCFVRSLSVSLDPILLDYLFIFTHTHKHKHINTKASN